MKMEFDKIQFAKAAQAFSEQLAVENLLSEKAQQALSVIGEAAVELVALCRESAGDKGPAITAKIAENVVQITGGGRNVVFAAAHGTASDHRLLYPRAQICGQLLVFCHLTGEQESNLLDTLRVYQNGDLTNGEMSANVDDKASGILPYLAHVVESVIFRSSIYWPGMDNMPSCMKRIPILEEELHEESLRRPCVGFECNLQRNSRDNH